MREAAATQSKLPSHPMTPCPLPREYLASPRAQLGLASSSSRARSASPRARKAGRGFINPVPWDGSLPAEAEPKAKAPKPKVKATLPVQVEEGHAPIVAKGVMGVADRCLEG